MKIYIINLDADVDRRQEICAQFERIGLAYTLFKAVDGRALNEKELAELYDREHAIKESHDLTRGEIGCALSHLGVYRDMVRENVPCALIVEDDAKLAAELPKVLAQLERSFSPEDAVVVLLNYVEKYLSGSVQALDEKHALVKTYGGIPNAHGYFINLAAAKKLVENLFPIWAVADRWDKFSRYGFIKVRAVVPYCIALTSHALDSNLDVDRVQRMTHYKRGGFFYYLHRYLYQKTFYQIFVRPFLRVKEQKRSW